MDATQETQTASVNDDLDSMQVQQVGPPEWRSILNFSHDLGYPDFFPSRPGFHQPEDVVTPVNVRQGFQGTNVVAAGVESVSVHAAISDRLKKQNIFKNVDALAMEILNARRDKAPKFPESTYKLPNRVVYNETMKKSFLNDLADEGIPLNSPKFAKSVPHGMKGQDLLEMLWTRRIKVDRAVWLVQIIGAHDVQNLRKAYDPSKTPFAPNQQYSITFTEAIVGYMNKQLAELLLTQQKMENGKALANNEAQRRQLWIEKWDYTQELLETLFGRQLLDVRTLGMWLRDSLQDVAFAQLPFVLDQLGRSRALVYEDLMAGTCIVAAAVGRLQEVVQHRARTALQSIERRLVESIKAAWYNDPRMFFFPHHWRNQENLLRAILPLSGGSDGMRQFQAVRARNTRALCYRKPPNLGISVLDKARNEALVGLQHLENYDPTQRLDKLCATYFLSGNQEASVESLRGKLNVLLDWGIKRYRISPHRPYLVAALVKQVLLQPGLRKAFRDNWIESHMWTWIDQACETTTGDMAAAARTLVAEFFNRGILSFGNYLERMIALGRTVRHATPANNVGKYLDFVTSLPLIDLPQSVVTLQRNITHGFQIEEAFQDRDRQLQQALTCYLSQAQGPLTRVLMGRALQDVPSILLNDKDHALFARCCRRLGDFRPSSTAVNATLRLYLLIHLFERRGDHLLLLELLRRHCRKLGISSPKAVEDAIQRHILLISCFRDEDPELYAASCQLAKDPWGVGHVQQGLAHNMDQEINAKERSFGAGDSDVPRSLRLASLTSLDAKTITSLWRESMETGALQPCKEARADVISKMADHWRNIACTSLPAWKAHLESWTLDADPTTATYEATSAMCLELVVRGAMEVEYVREKLVYPFLKLPSQVYQNRSHLQTVAALCSRLLVVDNTPSSMQDLMLSSAVTSNFARIAHGYPSAILTFLQRLPSMLLLMEEAPLRGRTNDVSAIATSSFMQSLAMQYENKTRQSFSAAVTEMPEKRTFWASMLGLLLGGPKEAGSILGMASTDWRDLASYTLTPGNTTGNANGHLPLPHAKAIVNAASQLVIKGETSTWWRMCASPRAQQLYNLNVAACSLISDLISLQPVLTRDALRQMECYLSIMEIARSGSIALEALPPGDPAATFDVLQDLLLRVESLSVPIPAELLHRLLSLMTSVTCSASRIDVADIQLRLLRLMDSCDQLNIEWTVDLPLLHYQIIRPNKRTQFLFWLEGSRLRTKPAFQRFLATSESNWETPPAICESSEYLLHRHSFARLTQPVNNGSLSLLQFGAVLTGDRVSSVNEDSAWSRFVSERDVGINPTGESFYLRNSVSGLSTLDDGSLEKQLDDAMDIDTPATEVAKKVGSTRPQPRKRVKVVRDL